MSKKLIYVALVVVFCLTSMSSAKTIIWVSDNQGPTNPNSDPVWIKLLQDNGYTVDLSFANQQGRVLDAAKIAALDAADLIIVTRNLVDPEYINGTEISDWNGITTPLLTLSVHTAKLAGWNWFNSNGIASTNVNMTAVVPTHPIFKGIALDAKNQVSVVVNNCKTTTLTSAGNGTVLATRFDDNTVWIALWEKGVEFYPGSGQFAGDLRMYFAGGKTDGGAAQYGQYNFTAEGERLFLNAVKYMIEFGFDPAKPSQPSPADKTADVPQEVALSWTPGEYAETHDVYLGTGFDDVNTASRTDRRGVLVSQGQADPTYDPPTRLDFGTTYYWRIDEVNAAPDSTIYKGAVWSFTTEPVAYPVAGQSIKASASSSEPNQGPENTINSSGMTGDVHSDVLTAMWLTTPGAAGPAWIQYKFDKVLRLHEMWVWNHNGLMEPALGLGSKEVTIEYSTDGNDFKVLGTTHQFARATGRTGYTHNTTVNLRGIVAKYVKLTIHSNWGGILKQYGLSEVRFFSVPVYAREPSPIPGATNVDVDASVSWRAGREAAMHRVSISMDQQAVTDGNAPVQTLTSPGYTPALDLAGTYYWRVDEVNEAETPAVWQGDVWSFSTQMYAVVDDFESYANDSPKRVFQAWIDGAGFSPDEFFPQGNDGNGSGALVGYDPTLGSIMETKTIHGGKKAVPFYYGNEGKATSEATRTFSEPQDWSKHGIRSLCLYFSGRADNQGARLYVRINNGDKLFYQGTTDDLKQPIWMAFIIDLAAVSANLSSVKTLTIGIEGAAATGTLLIDDIRLYPMAGELITPMAPDTAGLLARYRLDGDAKDSAGSHHGTLVNTAAFVDGKYGQAMNVILDQYVTVPYSADLSLNSFTVAAWVNVSDIAGTRGILGTRFGGDMTFDLKVRATDIHGDLGNGVAWLNTAVDVPVVLSVGQWYHVAYAIDHVRGTAELYLNGLPARTIAITGTPLFMKAGQELRIGTSNSTEYMRGAIDDVRIYNRALSPGEVAGLAGRTAPLYKPF